MRYKTNVCNSSLRGLGSAGSLDTKLVDGITATKEHPEKVSSIDGQHVNQAQCQPTAVSAESIDYWQEQFQDLTRTNRD